MSEKLSFNKALPHIIAVAIFVIINLVMYSPMFFEGEKLNQNDYYVNCFSGASRL